MKKWLPIIVLLVIGVIAAYVAIEYLTVPIHKLPHYLGYKHVRGHYKRRGYAAGFVAVVAFVGAGYLIYRGRSVQPDSPPGPTAATPTQSSAGDLLSSPTAPVTGTTDPPGSAAPMTGESPESSAPESSAPESTAPGSASAPDSPPA